MIEALGELQLKMSFESCSLQDIPVITEAFEKRLDQIEFSLKSTMMVNIAIDELYSNIVKFAYNGQPGYASIRLYCIEGVQIAIEFIDRGIPYDPTKKEDPDISPEGIENRVGGLGIYMVKKSMDDVLYSYQNGENHTTIIKKF